VQVKLTGDQLADVSADILGRAASLRFIATGSSMSPFIRDGDLVTVRPVNAVDLRLGDVVLYKSFGRRAILHRLIRRRKQAGAVVYLIRGDASAGACEEVKAEDILGCVVEVSKRGRIVAIGSWRWRVAALIWAYTSPITFRTLRLVRKLRRLTTDN
jgi:signal peptidase I